MKYHEIERMVNELLISVGVQTKDLSFEDFCTFTDILLEKTENTRKYLLKMKAFYN